jgi:type II secretory pathway component PulK
MIISEDPAAYDDLTEVWAVPIAPIRMTDIAGAQEAFFSGRLMDAQALFNLRNLRKDGDPLLQQTQLTWASTLMQSAGLTAVQASAWAAKIQALPEASASTAQMFDTLPDGISSAIKTNVETLFVWLPERSTININTVQQAVLAAHPNVGASLAQQLILTRNSAPLRLSDAASMANSLTIPVALAQQFGINTRYFLATGRLAVGRIDVMARSLMQRQNGGPPKLLWSQPL